MRDPKLAHILVSSADQPKYSLFSFYLPRFPFYMLCNKRWWNTCHIFKTFQWYWQGLSPAGSSLYARNFIHQMMYKIASIKWTLLSICKFKQVYLASIKARDFILCMNIVLTQGQNCQFLWNCPIVKSVCLSKVIRGTCQSCGFNNPI